MERVELLLICEFLPWLLRLLMLLLLLLMLLSLQQLLRLLLQAQYPQYSLDIHRQLTEVARELVDLVVHALDAALGATQFLLEVRGGAERAPGGGEGQGVGGNAGGKPPCGAPGERT